jgi:hypothetical protein
MKTSSYSVLIAIIIFSFGIVVGFLIGKGYSPATGVLATEIDNNRDGRSDGFFYYENDVLTRVESDRNFDGKVDQWEIYQDGVIRESRVDDNFDGQVDGWFACKDGILAESRQDTDWNGTPDIWTAYQSGVCKKVTVRPGGRAHVTRVTLYEHGVPVRSYEDSNSDGLLETLEVYDAFGNELRKETLKVPLKLEDL